MELDRRRGGKGEAQYVDVAMMILNTPNQSNSDRFFFFTLANSAYLLCAEVTWAGYFHTHNSRQITSKLYHVLSGALLLCVILSVRHVQLGAI